MEEESEKLRQLQSEVAFHDQLFDYFVHMVVSLLFDKVSCLVILFHSLCQWILFTQAPKKILTSFQGGFHSHFPEKFSPSFICFQTSCSDLSEFEGVCGRDHTNTSRDQDFINKVKDTRRLHSDCLFSLELIRKVEINRSTGWHKWTSWRRSWTSTSASLWRRNSGAPSLNRWHLKQPRKLLWPQDIFFFLQSGFDLDQLTMDAQFSRNRPVARRKDIFLRYFSFLFCLGLAGGPNSWQVISFKSKS